MDEHMRASNCMSSEPLPTNDSIDTSVVGDKKENFKESQLNELNFPILDLPEALNVELWEYLAEGNANVVFRANLPYPEIYTLFHQSNVVLRLRKLATLPTSIEKESLPTNSSLYCLEFLQSVLKPLFSSKHLPPYYLFKLTPNFLNQLQTRLSTLMHRPSSRHSTFLDVHQSFGLLTLDYTSRGRVCIELKPKWLVPFSTSMGFKKLNFENETKNTISTKPGPSCQSKCRFCLHQKLKLHSHSTTTTLTSTTTTAITTTSTTTSTFLEKKETKWKYTQFCPLDLLNLNTLPNAIAGLLASPNNNLKVWQDGHFLSLSSHSSSSSSSFRLFEMLVQVFQALQPLLHTLSYHQQKLDQSATSLFSTSISSLSSFLIMNKDSFSVPDFFSTQEWKAFIQSYLMGTPYDSPWTPYLAYSLSKTLKDCSIFVTLISMDSIQPPMDCVLLDLDPKPLHKLPSWLALENELLTILTNE